MARYLLRIPQTNRTPMNEERMMTMNKTLKALAFASAFATVNANAVIQIDLTGSGNIGGSLVLPSINWAPGNLLLDEGAGASSATAHLLGQSFAKINQADANSPILSYQFDIPISSTRDATTGQTSRSIANNGLGTFKLFLDLVSDVNQAAGTGYGDLNAATGGTAQVELLSGNVSIVGGSFGFVSGSAADPTKAFWLSENNTINDIMTLALNGSFSVNVNVLTQNNSYVTNDMVNAGITVDLSVLTLGPLSPFDPQVPASSNVVGSGAIDYGNDESIGLDVFDHDDPTVQIATGVTKPLNDFDCSGQGIFAVCDAQFQTSGNAQFRGRQVPEPTGLALTGLALTLIGLARRRRKG